MINLDRRIVCAANRNWAGTIIVGPRHWDSTMHRTHELMFSASTNDTGQWEQGFINTWGEFLNRRDAWIVAAQHNQILNLVGSQDNRFQDSGYKLYSENLY